MFFKVVCALTLLPALAFATETGLKDSDLVTFTSVNTHTRDLPEEMLNAPALCVLGRKQAETTLPSNTKLTPSPAAASSCDFLSFLTPHIEVVKQFDKSEVQPAFWNADETNPAPLQFTFEGKIHGSEFNAALTRLKAKCSADECERFELVVVRGSWGSGYPLPLRAFKVGPAASSVAFDREKGSFSFENLMMEIISR